MSPSTIDLADPDAVHAAVVDPDRLAEIRATGLVDAGANSALDRITRLAERLLGVSTALITIVDRDRQHFASGVGLSAELAAAGGTPLSHSFCQYAVASRDRFVVPDAREHPLVRDNPAVAELDVIAYAGHPLETSGGHVLGSLCVVESEARQWTDDDLHVLGELAELALSEIEYRLRANAMRNLERLVAELQGPTSEVGDAVRRMADRAERHEDPVVARLATAARSRVANVERAAEAILEAARWREDQGDRLHRPAMLGERMLQAARTAMASVLDRSVDTEVRDRPLALLCDGYALERALTNLLVGAMQQSPESEPVEVSAFQEDDFVVLEMAAEGGALPVAELSRLVGQLRAAITDELVADEQASLRTSGREVRIVHGPITASTGPSGTYLQLRAPILGSSGSATDPPGSRPVESDSAERR